MSFTIKKGSSKKTGLCKLAAGADLTIYGASQNHEKLAKCIPDYNNFVVDLSSVEEVDCSGVQLLLALKCSIEKVSGQFSIASVSDPVAEVLNVLNIKDQFTWADQ